MSNQQPVFSKRVYRYSATTGLLTWIYETNPIIELDRNNSVPPPRSICIYNGQIFFEEITEFFYCSSSHKWLPSMVPHIVKDKKKFCIIPWIHPILSREKVALSYEEAYEQGYRPSGLFSWGAGLEDSAFDQRNMPYNLSSNRIWAAALEVAYETYEPKFNTLDGLVYRWIESVSFGVELEAIPESTSAPYLGQMGVATLRDGSIGHRGSEFTTIPYEGSKGVRTLMDVCQYLNSTATTNLNCGLHINIASTTSRMTKMQALALYLLYERVQHSILEMLPRYLMDPVTVANKRKNYAAPLMRYGLFRDVPPENLDNLDLYAKECYDQLFKLLMGSDELKRDRFDEPIPPWGSKKWDSPTRYLALNFTNFFLEKPQVEFRVHPGVLNPNRILPWLLICVALYRYAYDQPRTILKRLVLKEKIFLEDALKYVSDLTDSPRILDYLLRYIETEKLLRIEEQVSAVTRASIAQGGQSNLNAQFQNDGIQWILKSKEFNFEVDGYSPTGFTASSRDDIRRGTEASPYIDTDLRPPIPPQPNNQEQILTVHALESFLNQDHRTISGHTTSTIQEVANSIFGTRMGILDFSGVTAEADDDDDDDDDWDG